MSGSLIVSIAALAVAIGTAVWSGWYTHRSADRRELRAWRRSELLAVTGELLRLSTHRQAVLGAAFDARAVFREAGGSPDPYDVDGTGGPHPRHSVDQMMLLAERIRLIEPGALAQAAAALAGAHRDALAAADGEYERQPDPVSNIDAMMVPIAALAALHEDLMDAFRGAVGLTSHARRDTA